MNGELLKLDRLIDDGERERELAGEGIDAIYDCWFGGYFFPFPVLIFFF